MKLPELIIDSHEPNTMILEIEKYPEYFPKFKVEELGFHDEDLGEFIPCGDYSNVNKSFVVERKVIHTQKRNHRGYYKDGDFHNSLMMKRLQDQLSRINFFYERNKWLLCEGYLVNYAISHPDKANFAYSIVGHCGRMNINFRECFDTDDFLLNLYWINRESGSEPFLRQDVASVNMHLISQLKSFAKIPGVGEKRATSLFKVVGNVYGFGQWIMDSNRVKIADIGPKTIKSLEDWYFDEVLINSDK